jgi:GGDEF domain-containing protein
VAVHFMDLDDFKVVNDSLGREAGDLLLTVVAQRLERCPRPEDTLARFGGDECTVLIESVEDPGEGVRVARRITDELRRPFALEGRELYVSDTDIRPALAHDGQAFVREAPREGGRRGRGRQQGHHDPVLQGDQGALGSHSSLFIGVRGRGVPRTSC